MTDPTITAEAGWAFDDGQAKCTLTHGGPARHCCTRAGLAAAYPHLVPTLPSGEDIRDATLRLAYWKLREHASSLRATLVYRKASERAEGQLGESPAFQRYRWLEATARGIEDGARDLAELLGVPECEIEEPAPAQPEETTCGTCAGAIVWVVDEDTGQEPPRWRHVDQAASYRSPTGAHRAAPADPPPTATAAELPVARPVRRLIGEPCEDMQIDGNGRPWGRCNVVSTSAALETSQEEYDAGVIALRLEPCGHIYRTQVTA